MNQENRLKIVMRDREGAWELRELCRDVKESLKKVAEENGIWTFYEIGSYAGESSEIFIQEFPKFTVKCIDPWKEGYDESDPASQTNMKEVRADFLKRLEDYPNWDDFVGTSREYFNKINTGDIKLCVGVYIDGSHKYEDVKQDLIDWLPKICKGGIISGHDYYDETEEFLKTHTHIAGVKKAVDEIVGKPDKTYDDGSWLKIIN